MTYLTLGSVWKMENSYAKDFIKYHRSVGVEKFVIFDREYNELKEMMKGELDVEIVSYPETPNSVHAQGWCDITKHCNGKTKWLVLIDADEALVPVKTYDVKEILKEYENYGSLQFNWSTLGSGGQDERKEGSLYERFTMRAKLNEGINDHTQYAIMPEKALFERGHDPHHGRLLPNEISVNTNKQQVQGPFNRPPLHDILYVAHYITKSKEEWRIKNAKGRGDIFGAVVPYTDFDAHNSVCNEEKETKMLKLWERACGK
jgi:Glycosyltransferase family 92